MANKIGKSKKSFATLSAQRSAKRNETAQYNGMTQSFRDRADLQAAMQVSKSGSDFDYYQRADRSAEAAQQIIQAMEAARERDRVRTAQSGYQADGSYVDRSGVRMSKAYMDNLQTSKAVLEGKGEKGQLCNRTACQAPGAYWYNHGTQAYYCGTCADIINEDGKNFRDSYRDSLGHPLLTLDEDFLDKRDERM